MFRTVISWFATRLRRQEEAGASDGDGDGDGDGDEEEGGFLPSRLDASVLTAHGMGTSQAEREMADIEEHAELLEEHHREK